MYAKKPFAGHSQSQKTRPSRAYDVTPFVGGHGWRINFVQLTNIIKLRRSVCLSVRSHLAFRGVVDNEHSPGVQEAEPPALGVLVEESAQHLGRPDLPEAANQLPHLRILVPHQVHLGGVFVGIERSVPHVVLSLVGGKITPDEPTGRSFP